MAKGIKIIVGQHYLLRIKGFSDNQMHVICILDNVGGKEGEYAFYHVSSCIQFHVHESFIDSIENFCLGCSFWGKASDAPESVPDDCMWVPQEYDDEGRLIFEKPCER